MVPSMSIASFIGGAVSGGSSILGSIMSHITARKQIAAQQRENQLNREFNAQQAALSRHHTLEMWNRNNSYNDPSAVMQRLRTAGIHPALAYSQGTQGFSASMASSPAQAGYSGGITPTMPDYSGIVHAGASAADAIQSISSAGLNKSMQSLNDIQAQYLPQLLKGEVDFLGVRVKMGDASSALDTQQAINLSESLGIITEQINLLKQQYVSEMAKGQVLGQQYQLTKPFVERAVEISEYKIGKLAAEFKISDEQAKRAAELVQAGLGLQLAQTYAANMVGRNQSEQSRLNGFLADMKGWYAKAYAAYASDDAGADYNLKRAMEKFYDKNGILSASKANVVDLEAMTSLLGVLFQGLGTAASVSSAFPTSRGPIGFR